MIDGLPGKDIAEQLGYTLFSYSGSGEMARYSKGQLQLKIVREEGKLRAELMAQYGLIRLTTDTLAFPNRNLGVFEDQLLGILEMLPPE